MVNPTMLHCKTWWKHSNPSTSVIMQRYERKIWVWLGRAGKLILVLDPRAQFLPAHARQISVDID